MRHWNLVDDISLDQMISNLMVMSFIKMTGATLALRRLLLTQS